MPGKIPENIFLYRIVHWQNLGRILLHGIYYREHPMADPEYVNIGHPQLIADRHEHNIMQLPGAGNLGEYVPFYFGPHSPMLLMIRNGTPPIAQQPQEDIVYIITSVKAIKAANLEYCFTDMHARRALAGFYRDDADFANIDWDVVGSKYWNNIPDYRDRQDRKQAEFLVRHHVPVSCIRWLGVRSAARKEYFEAIIANLGLSIQVYLDTENKLFY